MSIIENLSKVYVALGANIDTPHATRFDFICFAVNQLDQNENIEVVDYSKIYETLPVGFADQSNFLNCVLEIKTNLSALELLNFCKNEIEIKSGREKTIENGPRTIDVDLLLFNDETIDTELLIVPHPRMYERAFVLVPLKELASDLVGDIEQYKLVDNINDIKETEYDIGVFLNKYARDVNQKSWA
jgi:2-amino-4-hydroxy-6-hydroxymethyldihydropteridine diphosphokinase